MMVPSPNQGCLPIRDFRVLLDRDIRFRLPQQDEHALALPETANDFFTIQLTPHKHDRYKKDG
jgi:hypothetical protein